MIAGFDRYFQIAPCFRDEDARADRSPGEFYQLDLEMSFVTQEDVFAAVEPVMRGVFEEFADGKPVTPKFPLIPYAEAMRKYGTDKPDLRNPIDDAGRHRGFPRLRLQDLRQHSGDDPKNAVWAIPAPKRRQPRLLRPHELVGARRGPAGARLHLLARGRGEAAPGPLAKNIGPERTKQIADADSALGVGDAVLLRRRQAEGLRQVRRSGAHQGRRGARADRQGPLRVLLDRRLPDVRMERGGEEDRLLAQPVLDAEHAGRGIPRARSERPGQAARRSRRSSTTSSATASNCRPARSAIIAPR